MYCIDYFKKFKIIVIGDSNVGKTNIIKNFITEDNNKNNNENNKPTIGIEILNKIYFEKNKKFWIELWDTAGQERFRGISNSYYKDSSAILLIFDLTEYQSFRNWE